MLEKAHTFYRKRFWVSILVSVYVEYCVQKYHIASIRCLCERCFVLFYLEDDFFSCIQRATEVKKNTKYIALSSAILYGSWDT